MPLSYIRWAVAGRLVGLGVYKLIRSRHFRWGGMQVGFRELTIWSFLMASAHGAGLMVVPIFLGMAHPPAPAEACHLSMAASVTMSAALLATALHAVGYLAVTAIVSVVVFEKLGVGLLRRAWLNLDALWAAAPIGTGVLTFLI